MNKSGFAMSNISNALISPDHIVDSELVVLFILSDIYNGSVKSFVA